MATMAMRMPQQPPLHFEPSRGTSPELAEAADLIDTNLLLDQLRGAAAAAMNTLLEEEAAADNGTVDAVAKWNADCCHKGDEPATPAETPVDRLRASREAVRNPAVVSAMRNIDTQLSASEEAIKAAAAANEVQFSARREQSLARSLQRNHQTSAESTAPREGWRRHLESVNEALNGTDDVGVISGYNSEVTGRRARELAERGKLCGLQQIQAERIEWPAYLTLQDWDTADTRGNTALMLACEHGHLECVESLLSWGANPAVTNQAGATALHLAASRPITTLLLRSGADPTALDSLGRTPYMVAKANHLGGGSRAEVVHAFEPHQQVTAAQLAASERLTSMSSDGQAAQRWRAKTQARKEAVAQAARLYYQGVGASALEKWAEAAEAFRASLALDGEGAQACLAREQLEAAEQRELQQP